VYSNGHQDEAQKSLRDHPPQEKKGAGSEPYVHKTNQNEIHPKQGFAYRNDAVAVTLKRQGSRFSLYLLIRGFFAGVHDAYPAGGRLTLTARTSFSRR
jgi:hypothetical protein